MVIKAPDPKAFRCGRNFAAWIGLTPKDHSTAGKMRLGVITRAGDEALRRTLVLGATLGDQAGAQRQGHPLAMAARLAGTQAAQARRRGARQQGCAHCLEADGQWGTLRCGTRRHPCPENEGSTVLGSSRPLRAACGGGLRPALTSLPLGAQSPPSDNDATWASPVTIAKGIT